MISLWCCYFLNQVFARCHHSFGFTEDLRLEHERVQKKYIAMTKALIESVDVDGFRHSIGGPGAGALKDVWWAFALVFNIHRGNFFGWHKLEQLVQATFCWRQGHTSWCPSDPSDPAAGFSWSPTAFIGCEFLTGWIIHHDLNPTLTKPGKVVSQFWANDEQTSPRSKWSSHPLRCGHAHAGSLELLQGLGSRHAGTRQELGEGLGNSMGWVWKWGPCVLLVRKTLSRPFPIQLVEPVIIQPWWWKI